MFEDFLNLTYTQTKNKLRKIRELLNRVSLPKIEYNLKEVNERITRLDSVVVSLYEYLQDKKREREEEEEDPPIPPEPELLPDLTISNIDTTNFDQYVNFRITVLNQGTAESGACKLDAVIPGISNVTLDIPSLGIGGSTIVNHQYSFDPLGDEATKTIACTADSTGVIIESNEGNNTKSESITVKKDYTPPIGKGYVIVHAHNPEGIELGSIVAHISGIEPDSNFIGYIATNSTNHGIPQEYLPGNHSIWVKFNGITLTQNITVVEGETLELFYIFPRTIQNLNFNFSHSGSMIDSWDINTYGHYRWRERTYSGCLLSRHDLHLSVSPGQYPSKGNFEFYTDLTLTPINLTINNQIKYNTTSGVSFWTLLSQFYTEGLWAWDEHINLLWANIIPILNQTSFDNWYCYRGASQYDIDYNNGQGAVVNDDSYPYFYLNTEDNLNQQYIGVQSIYYPTGRVYPYIPANLTYTKIRAWWTRGNSPANLENFGKLGNETQGGWGLNSDNKTRHSTANGNHYMSSIPYDFLNLGV